MRIEPILKGEFPGVEMYSYGVVLKFRDGKGSHKTLTITEDNFNALFEAAIAHEVPTVLEEKPNARRNKTNGDS